MANLTTNVTAKKVAIWTATIVLVLLGFEFLWLIRNVIFLVFLSILLATGIEPLVRLLRKGPFSKGTGILAVYTLIFGVIALILFLTVPPLIEEGRGLVSRFTNPDNIRAAINTIENEFLRGVALTAYDNAGALLGGFKLDPGTVSAVFPIFEVIFSFFTVFVIAYYWLTERPLIKRFVFSFIPEKRKARGRLLWDSVEEKLGAWVRGQLVLMLFIGVLSGIGYTIMGLKFAFPLAVFAGFAELIPLVGPYIGGAPAVLIALTQDPTLAIVVVIYIVILQLIEGNVLVPRIMEKAVGVTPLTVVIGILIGSTLMGIGGALLAVPVAAAAQVIFNNILSFSSEETDEQEAVAASTNTAHALKAATVGRERERQTKNESSGDHIGGTPVGS